MSDDAGPGRVSVTLRMPSRLHAELVARTVRTGHSLNDTIVRSIDFALDATGRLPADEIEAVAVARARPKSDGF